MAPDLEELRQRAAEELTGFEAELAEWEERFRAYDPEGAELLDELSEWLEENEIVAQWREKMDIEPDEADPVGPYEVAFHTALGRDDPEITEKGEELLHRLAAFRDETDSPYPTKSNQDEDQVN